MKLLALKQTRVKVEVVKDDDGKERGVYKDFYPGEEVPADLIEQKALGHMIRAGRVEVIQGSRLEKRNPPPKKPTEKPAEKVTKKAAKKTAKKKVAKKAAKKTAKKASKKASKKTKASKASKGA